MKKMIVSSVLSAVAGVVFGASPVVRSQSVVLSQEGTVLVKYALDGAPGIVTVDFLTNGVSIGAANFANVSGDVNRKVEPGDREIKWRPNRSDWAKQGVQKTVMTAKVTAWSPNTPPDYLVLGLERKNDVRYYVSREAFPGGYASDEYKSNCLVMRKVLAAGQTFRMGSNYGELGREDYVAKREKPHLVTLTNDFFAAVYLTTQEQYEKFMGTNPSSHKISAAEKFLPVENISYDDLRGSGWPEQRHAVANGSVCGTLRALTGMDVDLPTDAQWEFVCRAGTGSALNSGKMTTVSEGTCPNTDEVAWYLQNSNNKTHTVGQKKGNDWGFHDMHGNVYEWVLDWVCLVKGPDLTGAPAVEPVGFTTAEKTQFGENQRGRRGGTFGHHPKICRSAFRGSELPTVPAANTGFRLVCPIDGRW